MVLRVAACAKPKKAACYNRFTATLFDIVNKSKPPLAIMRVANHRSLWGIIMNTSFVFNDGGRKAAGYKGNAGDCVCRAIAIAAQLSYQQVYDRLAEGNAAQRKSKRTGKQFRSARNGIYTTRKWFKDYMLELGFVWTPTMQVGSGCHVHLTADELPTGRIICSVSRHYVAVIDGVINDTHDCSRAGTRCVYGYWKLPDQ